MEPNFNADFNDLNLPEVSKKPYYEPTNPQIINLKKTGFTSYFWVVFGLFWTGVILGGGGYLGYRLYKNNYNPLAGMIVVNNEYEFNFTIPVDNKNTNNNVNNIDIPTPQINNTIVINNNVNNTNST